MIDEEVRKLIDASYIKTKQLLVEKREEVEKVAKELLVKEVLFKSDVKLNRQTSYEEKKILEIEPEAVVNEEPSGHYPRTEKSTIYLNSKNG